MEGIKRLRRRFMGLALFAVLLAVVAITVVSVVPHARGDISGYSELRRLELAYEPGGSILKARLTLASGIALTYEALDEQDADRLFKMAQLYAQKGSRLAVLVEKDEIKEFRISIQ
jgi:hypothetical protein